MTSLTTILCVFLIVFQLALVHGFLFDTLKHLYNDYYLKCSGYYLKKDIGGLKHDLSNYLYGQPLVMDVVMYALQAHLRSTNSPKPLVLSFHGWPGSGKNYVSDFIVNRLYQEGYNSSYVHLFVSKHHFPTNEEVPELQAFLKYKIVNSVKNCEHSIFIFDEVEKYPAGVLDVVKPFLDFKEMIDHVNYRNAIFIFLSNIGGNVIVEKTLEMWKNGVNRNDFQLRDFEKLLIAESFNDKGGFFRSDIIDSHLIDNFVPFLPLEMEHVRLCVQHQFKIRGRYFPLSSAHVDEIIKDLSFGPEPENIFSTAGCKRIPKLVDKYVMKLDSSQNWNRKFSEEL